MFLIIIPFLIPFLIGGLVTAGLAKLFVDYLNKQNAKSLYRKIIPKDKYEEAKKKPVNIGLEEGLYSDKKEKGINPIKIWYNKKGEIVDSVQIEYKTIDENLAKELKKNEIVIL